MKLESAFGRRGTWQCGRYLSPIVGQPDFDKWLELVPGGGTLACPTIWRLSKIMDRAWLVWARELQALARSGLNAASSTFDRERYTAIRSLAARMTSMHWDANFVQVDGLFPEQTGCVTPKVDVRGAVIQDGRILLVREIADCGRWTMPGGWADINQSPSESVVRELREESGLEVRARKLAAVYDRARQGHPPHPFHVYRLFFLCDIVGGSLKPGLETSEVGFFGENEIPADLSMERILPHQIRRMFEHERDKDLPTDFD